MPWGSWGDSPSLPTGLGTDPNAGVTTSGWGQHPMPQPVAAPSSSGHTGWFGSITNPLGLTSFVKNVATGLGSSLGKLGGDIVGAGANTVENLYDTAAQRQTHWGDVTADIGHGVQHTVDFGGGLVLGGEQLATIASEPLGLSHVMRDDVFRPLNHFLAGKDEHGSGTWNAMISPEFAQQLYGQGKGYGPENFTTMARNQGLGAAALTTAAEAAIVVPGVGEAASQAAGGAESAAAAAAERGAVEEAAAYSARAEVLRGLQGKIANFQEALHPFARAGYNPIGQAGALLEKGGQAVEDKAALAGEEGTIPSAAVKGASAMRAAGGFANKPLAFIGINAGDLLAAMRNRVQPADLPVDPTTGEPVQPEPTVPQAATQGGSETISDPAIEAELQGYEQSLRTARTMAPAEGVTGETLSAIRDAQNPQTAAAEASASAEADPYAELHRLGQEAAAAAAPPEAPPIIPGEATTTLYRGDNPSNQANRGEAGDAGLWHTDNPAIARQMYAGEQGSVTKVEVPNRVLDQLKAEGGESSGRIEHNGESGAQYRLPPEYQGTGTLHEGPTEVPTEPAPKAEPKQEPATYNVTKGRPPMSAEARAADIEALQQEAAASRDKFTPDVYVYDRAGRRMQAPTPPWADALAAKLPDSINRNLGKLAGLTDEIRLRNVERALTQTLETGQKMARSSPAMRAAEASARAVLNDVVGRGAASDMVGQEIHARLFGEALLAEWIKGHDGFKPTPDESARLQAAARGHFDGITDEAWARLSPEARVALQQHLNDAVELFKQESINNRGRLLASRYGAKGLEEALLHPDEVGMTREQQRLYSRSLRQQRFAEKALERVPDERAVLEGKAALADAQGERKWGVVDRLRQRFGLNEATTEELYRGIPDGMKDEAAASIAATVAAVANDGHAYLDPATGEVATPQAGIFVPIALQGAPVPIDQWATAGPQAVHEHIMFPVTADGNTYDPVALYQGEARLSYTPITLPDGSQAIQAVLGRHSINGDPIVPWQAAILGDANATHAGYDFGTGEQVPFNEAPVTQTVAQHYVGDVLNPRSRLSVWANQKAQVAAELGIGPNELNSEIRALLTIDQVMAQRPNQWVTGDIFKTETSIGLGEPLASHVLQTIMPELSTMEHFNQALVHADFDSVNKMLEWYYTSHNAIEGMWRGKITPFGRDAAETFYDLVALTSVMASPTQNLGRALAGFANLDDFLTQRQDAIDNAHAVMNELMGNKRAETAYVKNLGVTRESYLEKYPQQPGEKPTTLEKRVRANIEQEVAKGEGGTAVSRRWLDSPVARDLTAQTSMTTGPKYRIIDALLGNLNLETATAEDIGKQPEWWFGKGNNYSDEKLAPSAVVHHAELLGITGPQLDAYQQWIVQHEALVGARSVREGADYVRPISDSEDLQRKASPSQEGGRRISLQENQDLGMDGRGIIAQAKANSSPTVDLRDPAFIQQMYDATKEQWGGGTLDTHTGEFIPVGENADPSKYSVTMREGPSDKTIEIKPGSDIKTFTKQWLKAVSKWGDRLQYENGAFGVFHNVTPEHPEGVIELDPAMITTGVHDTEAVGVASHADGGAFHFSTMDGHWTPHVADEYVWGNKTQAAKDVNASKARGSALAKAPEMRKAYENALMEYHGSGLLAKLRSFRENLADPHNSLAVTLDSIMAQLFGIEGTPWATKNEYAGYADQIRQVAKEWSTIAGRQIMPHEVQAALWVYAKHFIGTQDWGRWNAHLTKALSLVDDFENARQQGYTVKLPATADLLSEAWREELQFSRDQLAIRSERTPLRAQASAAARGKAEPLTPEQADRLAYLEEIPGRQTSTVRVQPDGQPITEVQRDETYFDANTLRGKENQHLSYLTKYATPIREALQADNFDEARRLLREYVIGRQKSMLQGIDGDAFDKVLRKSMADPNSVTHQSLLRLEAANHVPHPNVDGITGRELLSHFADHVRGLTLEHPNAMGRIMMRLFKSADWTTMLHEDLHAFRLLAPGDEVAQLSHEYPNLQDATMTDARRADEERFVQDFMTYAYERAKAGDPRLSPAQRAQARYNGPLKGLFNNVADAVDEYSRAAIQTPGGSSISNRVLDYWDSIFNQEIVKPDTFHDPLSPNYSVDNKGVNPKQLRGESDFNFVQRVRQYGEARGKSEGLQRSIAEATRRAQEADRFANKMKGLLLEPTRSEFKAAQLQARSDAGLAKLNEQLGNPSANNIPRAWRPWAESIDRIAEEAKDSPTMGPVLKEISENFPKMLELARELGFEPTYMPDMTWQMAQRYMYGHLTLGSNAEESSMRKQNNSVLSRAGITSRSMEALGAATVMSMKELLGSHLVRFIEENYARQWRAGVAIPDGWHAWSATRDAILTGKNIKGENVSAYDTLIVPDAVHSTLLKMQGKPVDMPLRGLFKGGPTAVWKNIMLTYSPSWYLKHFIGATTLAALEGVRLQDWRKAWQQFKTDELPDVAQSKTIYDALDMQGRSLISRNKWKELPDVARSEGLRSAGMEFNTKLRSLVSTVDSLNRAAVYAKTMRLTENPALAASRAVEALGDFGRLSPLERNVVSSLLPFYSFQKAMFRILVHLPADHPLVTVMALQLGLMHQEYLKNKLGGAVPDAYLSAIDVNGKLTPMDKMNPLTDSYKLVTPEGIVGSLHPFLKPLAEQAYGSQQYGSGAGMSPTGSLVPTANPGQQYLDMYSNVPIFGGGNPGVYSSLSDKQYTALLKRIKKTLAGESAVAGGGYLVTDFNKAKAAAAPKQGWGQG